MATLTGFSRPQDPINCDELAEHIIADIGIPVTDVVYPTEISITGDITEANRTAIQNSINTYVYGSGAGSGPWITLTGDITGYGPSPLATTLSSVVTPATKGSATQVPVITYDAKGRITNATTATISSGTQRAFPLFAE